MTHSPTPDPSPAPPQSNPPAGDPNKKISPVKLAGACLLLGITAVALTKSLGLQLTTPPAEKVWFYNLGSHELVALDDTLAPTLQGQELARVYAYSCGSCSDPHKMAIAYFEKFSPDAIDELRQMQITTYSALASEPWNKGRYISPTAKNDWHPANTPAALEVVSRTVTCPDGKPTSKLCIGPQTQ